MQISSANSIPQDQLLVPDPGRVPVRTLGQDDFLKLVIAQLTTQDPLSPQKDTEFIAQMAQFSTLEQSKSMQTDIARLRTEQQFLQANAMLGRVVELQVDRNTLTRGLVSAIQVEAGTPQIVVNGRSFELSSVLSIEPAPTAPTNP